MVRLYRDGTAVIYEKHKKNSEKNILNYNRKSKVIYFKQYKINKKLIRSACLALYFQKRCKHLIFLTLTLCEDIKDLKKLNIAFRNFLDNICKRYNIKNYVYVIEKQKTGRYHYHLLIDAYYLHIKALQKAWESSIKHVFGVMHIYHNSVRLGNNCIVSNIRAVKNYLSKYVEKSEAIYNTKCYGKSETLKCYISIYNENDFKCEIMQMNYKVIVKENFYTIIIIFDYLLLQDLFKFYE